MHDSRRKGRYGVDAPYVPMLMIAGSVICVGLILFVHIPQLWLTIVILMTLASVCLHTTLGGKFRVWRTLLDGMEPQGDERVLDLDCGRGAVLLMAADYLPHGRAVGIEIWSVKDQSGNAVAVTQANAVAEGVADRVELQTADMRQLPFESGSFDVIVASVAIHNISAKVGRHQAVDEAGAYCAGVAACRSRTFPRAANITSGSSRSAPPSFAAIWDRGCGGVALGFPPC
jgi:arsenite methyltransferase